MNLEEFRAYVKKHDANCIGKKSDLEDDLQDVLKSFALVCKKCGSLGIEINFEQGVDYGEWTGYQSGTHGIKCKGCGSATWWYE